jgi:hypothetical protein
VAYKATRIIIVNILISFALVEIIAIVWVEILKNGHAPMRALSGLSTSPIYVDVNPVFGVWHLPNAHNRMIKPGINAAYSFNTIGARDFERPLHSTSPRIVLIGDSFAEGYGVDTCARFSNILEGDLNVPVLNFGTGGGFGSTQERLLYESMASRFDHAIVLLCLLPDNDFDDDDLEFGKKYTRDRYRPYLVPKGDSETDFEVQYFVPNIEESSWHPSNIGQRQRMVYYIEAICKTQSYAGSALALRANTGRWRGRRVPANSNIEVESRYNSFSDEGLSIMVDNIYHILEVCESEQRKLVVVLIPTLRDILAYHQNPRCLLTHKLEQYFAANPSFRILDLLPVFSGTVDFEELYFKYDPHWNERGHALAAKILIDFFARNNLLP